MVDTAHFPSTYRDLSWRQAWNFKKTTEEVLSSGPTDSRAFQQDVKNWRTVARRIDVSVNTSYKNIWRFFFELFTLQIFKKWMISRAIPDVLAQTRLKVHTVAKHLWSKQRQITPLELIDKAEAYFNSHIDSFFSVSPPGQPRSPLEVAMTISSLSRACIETQVRDYFQTKRALINQGGHPVTIGRLFHATREETTGLKIITSGHLQQHQAPAGNGVYFSTRHEQSYGPLCLAIDPETLQQLPASYFPRVSPGTPDSPSVWIRVETNVPIVWSSVSHFVVSSANHEYLLREQLQREQAFFSTDAATVATCPIIYTPTNEILMDCFNHSSPKPILPPHWKRHSWCRFNQDQSFPTHLPMQEAESLLMA